MIIPKHVFEAFKGAKSARPGQRQAVGTGPYKYVDSSPATSSAAS